ncbi:SDR family oxidoreductase [Geothrix mesophila]|uniref:SDR family oxidoreductase n=1 Tax=Geothrix mesophila TaxID=2922723 RepID=UPI001FAC24BA|nr:SDR family oxidoreductase [Geothrix sp. SG198]
MMNARLPRHILVVGGSSGMGLALAGSLLAQGDAVTIAGRSPERLAKACTELAALGRPRTLVADATEEADVVRLFEEAGPLDHLVTTAADMSGAYAPLPDLEVAAARRVMDSKVIGPWLLAKHGAPRLAPGGTITFTSGIAAHRPLPKGSLVAAANGALESLVRALAVELAPIRVNAVSPGWVDTPIWEAVAGAGKAEILEGMARRLPVGRIGRPTDIAEAIEAVMRNGFITGAVLHVDGGHRLI